MVLCEHCFINPIKGKVECGIIHKEIIKEYMTKGNKKTKYRVLDSKTTSLIQRHIGQELKNVA